MGIRDPAYRDSDSEGAYHFSGDSDTSEEKKSEEPRSKAGLMSSFVSGSLKGPQQP